MARSAVTEDALTATAQRGGKVRHRQFDASHGHGSRRRPGQTVALAGASPTTEEVDPPLDVALQAAAYSGDTNGAKSRKAGQKMAPASTEACQCEDPTCFALPCTKLLILHWPATLRHPGVVLLRGCVIGQRLKV